MPGADIDTPQVEPSTLQSALAGALIELDFVDGPLPRNWEGKQDGGSNEGKVGIHRGGSEHEPPTAAYIQIYVKSSVLSLAPDLAISTHLTTEAEIDEFVDDALAELEKVRIDAKKELAAA